MTKKASKTALYSQTRLFKVLLGIAMLLVGYGFASLAIDRAYFWAYVLTFVFLVWAVKYFVRSIRDN